MILSCAAISPVSLVNASGHSAQFRQRPSPAFSKDVSYLFRMNKTRTSTKLLHCSQGLRSGRLIEGLLGAGRRESMAQKAAGNPGGSKKSSPGSGTTNKSTGGKGGQGSSKTGKSKSGTK